MNDSGNPHAQGYVQVPLSLRLDDSATFDNYYVASASALMQSLQLLVEIEEGGWFYLWGGDGSGVSHLLQAVAAAAGESKLYAMYIDLKEVIDADPCDLLDNFEQFDLLCIDNIEQLAGRPEWEEQMFYLLDRLRRKPGSRLVLGAHKPVGQLGIALPDLESRLAWATVFQTPVLADDDKVKLLVHRAAGLGLELREEVAEYLLNRRSRDLPALLSTLDFLDQQALISQRRLTIPWIKSVLDL